MSFGVVRTRRAMRRIDRVHRVRGVKLIVAATAASVAISVAGAGNSVGQGIQVTAARIRSEA
jgi:hypothetical protein